MVVGGVLTTAALRFRDSKALFCAGMGRRFTFGQTNERCNRLAHVLTGLGLRKLKRWRTPCCPAQEAYHHA
jgi:non-ribosomal peptide synthetase component F